SVCDERPFEAKGHAPAEEGHHRHGGHHVRRRDTWLSPVKRPSCLTIVVNKTWIDRTGRTCSCPAWTWARSVWHVVHPHARTGAYYWASVARGGSSSLEAESRDETGQSRRGAGTAAPDHRAKRGGLDCRQRGAAR